MEEKERIINRAKDWLSDDYDESTRASVQQLIDSNFSELEESFYKDLEFGTGGLRGIMGVGTNRINLYTVAKATQGLSNYLKKVYAHEKIRMAVAYDSRINSKEYAQRTAEIFSANGIEVYLFPELRPTPQLSFTIRKLNCKGGIVITASHNPKEFNGYKVYWNDGGQLVPPHDKNIIEEVSKIDSMKNVKQVIIRDLIRTLNTEIDHVYSTEVIKQVFQPEVITKSDLKIVYTPIHGTGITMIPSVLSTAGFKNVMLVEEQSEPDGHFPTVSSPNPEEESAMNMALQHAKSVDADIVLGTDPDTDRVGIGIKNKEGHYELL
ncbi:MAG: phospho-sugar mutase, partial [Bacteroidota bacterium]